MPRFISVLLPVRDAQATLAASVHEILDIAADSGDRFELLIIDDGSTDATSEVAHELTYGYPQIRVVRNATPLGREAAIRIGLKRSRGEVIVLRDDDRTFNVVKYHHRRSISPPSHPTAPNYLTRLQDAGAN